MNQKIPDEIEVRYYEDENGKCPFERFFNRLSVMAAVKVTAALSRLRAGNTADSKSVGKGVSELRINWGPGYRLYYGWDGLKLVILLTGSAKKAKKQQSADISSAQNFWVDYKRRKGKGAS
ncbi:MAG: type II toxin-antitoxin system RelE/ParE family toxin [Desulfobacterales bacterium]